MTRTQWRRYQWSKKGVVASLENKVIDLDGNQRMVKSGRIQVKEILYLPPIKEDLNEVDELD